MATVTLELDDELLARARIAAEQNGRSLEMVVRELLDRYAPEPVEVVEARRREARARLVELSRNSTFVREGPMLTREQRNDRQWLREQAEERGRDAAE